MREEPHPRMPRQLSESMSLPSMSWKAYSKCDNIPIRGIQEQDGEITNAIVMDVAKTWMFVTQISAQAMVLANQGVTGNHA